MGLLVSRFKGQRLYKMDLEMVIFFMHLASVHSRAHLITLVAFHPEVSVQYVTVIKIIVIVGLIQYHKF